MIDTRKRTLMRTAAWSTLAAAATALLACDTLIAYRIRWRK